MDMVGLQFCYVSMILLILLEARHMATVLTHSHNGVCLFNLEGKIQ